MKMICGGFTPTPPLGLSAPDPDLLFSLMKKVSKKINRCRKMAKNLVVSLKGMKLAWLRQAQTAFLF